MVPVVPNHYVFRPLHVSYRGVIQAKSNRQHVNLVYKAVFLDISYQKPGNFAYSAPRLLPLVILPNIDESEGRKVRALCRGGYEMESLWSLSNFRPR